MPSQKSWSPIRGKKMRLTRLTAALAPLVGPASSGVSDGFVSVKITPQYEEAAAIQLKNANGDFCINEKGDQVLSGADAEIQFCGVNPDYLALITGFSTVLDFLGAATGLRLSGGVPVTNGYALEVWSGVAGANGTAWGYLLLPALKGGRIGEFTIQDGTATFTVTSSGQENPGWGVGPYNVVATDAQGVAGKLLTPLGAKDFVHMDRVTVAPPAATDGLVALA